MSDFMAVDLLDGRVAYIDLDTVVAVLDVFKADQRGPVPQIDRTKSEVVTNDGEHYFCIKPAAEIVPWLVASPTQRARMYEKEVAP